MATGVLNYPSGFYTITLDSSKTIGYIEIEVYCTSFQGGYPLITFNSGPNSEWNFILDINEMGTYSVPGFTWDWVTNVTGLGLSQAEPLKIKSNLDPDTDDPTCDYWNTTRPSKLLYGECGFMSPS